MLRRAEQVIECIWAEGLGAASKVVTDGPQEFSLLAAYPNPFNAETTILYGLAEDSEVELAVFAITGQRVGTLVRGYQAAGLYQVRWRAEEHAAGVYVYRLVTGEQAVCRRMMLLK